MSEEDIKDFGDASTSSADDTNKRDAEVARLERAIEEEREHSAGLRSTVNELKFQAEILEKSYSKQLEDARLTAESAERKADQQTARIAELDSAREDAIALLTDAKAEIDRLEHERDQFRRQLASQNGSELEEVDCDDFSDDGGTINALMNDAKWVREKQPDDEERQKAEDEARAAEEAAAEDMISPDLVFTAKAGDS